MPDKDKNTSISDQDDQRKKPAKGFWGVTKRTFSEYLDDDCLNLSAAIAYYALQSIIPLILGFIVIGSLFLQDNGTRQSFIDGVKSAIPAEIGQSIKFDDIIDGLIKGAGTAGVISVILLLWTGSGIFDQFIFSINKAFDVEKDERSFFFKLFLRFALLLGLGVLLAIAFTVTILFNVLFTAKVSIFGISPDNFSFILPVLSYMIPLILETCIFAILYKFSPARKGIKLKPVLVGAFIAAILFEILKVGFTLYITIFGATDSATRTYGALGGIIVFLLFLYLSGAIILLGAEITAVLLSIGSGYAAKVEEDAVVEAPGKEKDGHIVPQNKGQKGNAPEKETVVVTLPVSDSPPMLQTVASLETQPQKQDWAAMAIGAFTIIAAVAGNVLFRRRKTL